MIIAAIHRPATPAHWSTKSQSLGIPHDLLSMVIRNTCPKKSVNRISLTGTGRQLMNASLFPPLALKKSALSKKYRLAFGRVSRQGVNTKLGFSWRRCNMLNYSDTHWRGQRTARNTQDNNPNLQLKSIFTCQREALVAQDSIFSRPRMFVLQIHVQFEQICVSKSHIKTCSISSIC